MDSVSGGDATSLMVLDKTSERPKVGEMGYN